ncbi:mitogen activated protein kinase kinase kinase 3 [Colletotrichum abscissum]|uniref:non-specific serine/threonine protein kinase n=1 Tax=Colletotrichum abscissum TaxID=1671311 RepID=A0A9P9XSR9_9PEZI|nr:mitogen activated protein kinase kinase kinase 3 [Colletotrichum abscissum]KAI3558672.1 mitogen activated protein kinase kinase kinase 3 [Colletotrichum abscissum]KAK1511403.1 mitogen activated protein kinase kinase kinase 3 [Colletotrichum abscissum]
MASPNARTLFHLVPRNSVAKDALSLPENRRFVSTSALQEPGLEVGFHVASTGGFVIARLGRKGDLVLNRNTSSEPMCREHVAFEFQDTTKLIHLVVRSKKQEFTVAVGLLVDSRLRPQRGTLLESDDVNKVVDGEVVMLYGQNYNIQISSYRFDLVWTVSSSRDPPHVNNERLKELAWACFRQSMSMLKGLGSRDLPTGFERSEQVSHRITRPRTAKQALFRENKALRQFVGRGTFGTVYRSVDAETSAPLAIKVVHLGNYPKDKEDGARALFHRELKTMQSLNHVNIIEILGYDKVDTLEPEMIMPYRSGSLSTFVGLKMPEAQYEQACRDILEQMLCALDYLVNFGVVHRDLKPENILYDPGITPGSYIFQLADFGLANHQKLAKTMCGTVAYQAPELWPELSALSESAYKQSHKMDVWSLYAAFVAMSSKMKAFPPRAKNSISVHELYRNSKKLLIDSVKIHKQLAPMAELEPDRRASAAWMLNSLFGGRGLTTRPGKIEPYYPPGTSPPRLVRVQTAPRRQWSSNMDIDEPQNMATPKLALPQGGRADVDIPIIVHTRAVLDRRDAQLVQQKIRKQGGGVVKRRAKPRHPVAIR